jgi:hypothetical protein
MKNKKHCYKCGSNKNIREMESGHCICDECLFEMQCSEDMAARAAVMEGVL